MERSLFVNEVMAQVRVINRTVADDELLRFVVEDVVDRISLYLRYDDETSFDARLARVAAKVASACFKEADNNADSTEVDTSIKSMSDNGQSISYGNATKNYLATVEDGELFGGFVKLLQPYRRIRGVS